MHFVQHDMHYVLRMSLILNIYHPHLCQDSSYRGKLWQTCMYMGNESTTIWFHYNECTCIEFRGMHVSRFMTILAVNKIMWPSGVCILLCPLGILVRLGIAQELTLRVTIQLTIITGWDYMVNQFTYQMAQNIPWEMMLPVSSCTNIITVIAQLLACWQCMAIRCIVNIYLTRHTLLTLIALCLYINLCIID